MHVLIWGPRCLLSMPRYMLGNVKCVKSENPEGERGKALNIIKDLLVKDHTLKERTVMAVSDIILLLEFCLKNTYFSFQDQFYEQVEGAAMGSPVSPIVANLYMEYLEQKALSTAPTPQVLVQVDTKVSSTRKSTNKASFNIPTLLTLL